MDNGTLTENRGSVFERDRPMGDIEQEEVSLVDLLQTLLNHKWVAIVTALIVMAAAGTYAFTATPTYRAETILTPQRSGGGLGGMVSQFGGALGGIASMFAGGGNTRTNRLARGEALTSLTSTAHIQGFIRSKNLLPVLFDGRWDAEAGEWNVESEEDIPSLYDGYNLFLNEILEVEEDPLTGIINLSVEWKDPVLASEWANELVSTLNASLREKAIRDSDKTIDFLNQELERTKVVELRQALFFMIEQQIGDKTSARVQDEFAFKIIDPAIPPDEDKYVAPKRPLIIGAGLLGGIFLGICAAFLFHAIGQVRAEYKSRSEPDEATA